MIKYTDFFLVTTLKAIGYEFDHIESDPDTGKKTFIYADPNMTEAIHRLADQYYEGTLTVSSKKLWQEYTNLKSIIHNTSYLEKKYGQKPR